MEECEKYTTIQRLTFNANIKPNISRAHREQRAVYAKTESKKYQQKVAATAITTSTPTKESEHQNTKS